MKAGTIFVLCLGVAFVTFVVYLAILSRRGTSQSTETDSDTNAKKPRR
jgi:hypothetical protein